MPSRASTVQYEKPFHIQAGKSHESTFDVESGTYNLWRLDVSVPGFDRVVHVARYVTKRPRRVHGQKGQTCVLPPAVSVDSCTLA